MRRWTQRRGTLGGAPSLLLTGTLGCMLKRLEESPSLRTTFRADDISLVVDAQKELGETVRL